MKCTNNTRRRRNRRRRAAQSAAILILLVILSGLVLSGVMIFTYWNSDYTAGYEKKTYQGSVCKADLFAEDLCVTAGGVSLEGFSDVEDLHGAGLFDLDQEQVLYGYHLFDRIYPASTTKIMTAYLALKYGNTNDIVTISESATDFAWDEMTCGLETGDQISLYDLLCGLLLYSGNDCASAIAEHISGSEAAFADLMNQEAEALGATGTHFVNPHGLHDENHYTTTYDLYLIFQACMQDARFEEIISMDVYSASITSADGSEYYPVWYPTNYYSIGQAEAPDGIRVFGGKTGTTDEAGSCVILYNEDLAEHPYISVVMGAVDKIQLYDVMNQMLSAGIRS